MPVEKKCFTRADVLLYVNQLSKVNNYCRFSIENIGLNQLLFLFTLLTLNDYKSENKITVNTLLLLLSLLLAETCVFSLSGRQQRPVQTKVCVCVCVLLGRGFSR